MKRRVLDVNGAAAMVDLLPLANGDDVGIHADTSELDRTATNTDNNSDADAVPALIVDLEVAVDGLMTQ